MKLLEQARHAAEMFPLPDTISRVAAHGEGLIHDTFIVSTGAPGNEERFILQRINQQVFADPQALMENVDRVVSHLQTRAMQSGRDPQREVVSLIRTIAGDAWQEVAGHAWRMFRYVEGTMTIDQAPSVERAHQIGLAFGRFLDDLAVFPAKSLHTVLPGYRDTQRYLDSLWRVLEQDPSNRARNARVETAFIESRIDTALRLQTLQRSGEIPLRVIHGDTKLSNLLLDAKTGGGVCVIDLDTVMPGLLLHDIGDCVREALARSLQYRGSLETQDLQVFEAIISGFFSKLSTPPAPLEIANIVAGVKSITLELGARFLTDYLSGDAYFKTVHAEENLYRTRLQIHLLGMIESCESKLQAIVQRCVSQL